MAPKPTKPHAICFKQPKLFELHHNLYSVVHSHPYTPVDLVPDHQFAPNGAKECPNRPENPINRKRTNFRFETAPPKNSERKKNSPKNPSEKKNIFENDISGKISTSKKKSEKNLNFGKKRRKKTQKFYFFFRLQKKYFFSSSIFFEGIILRQILIPNSSLTLCFEGLQYYSGTPPVRESF